MNWYKTILFFIILGLNNDVLAEKSEFDKANAAYEEQNYTEAITSYKRLIDNGYSSLNLYYNLGNAYYKNNDIGQSILYFEKAQKLAPRNEDIAHNLKIAYASTADNIEPLPRLFFVDWWYSLLNYTSSSRWAIYGISILWLGLILAAIYLFTKIKILRRFTFLTCSISIVLLLLAWQKNNYDKQSASAIILQKEVFLKSTPNNNAKEIGTVHEGLKVAIIDSVDEWYEIQLQDGNKAWVEKSSLGAI